MALSTNRTLITQTGINTHQVLNVGGLDSAGIATFSNFKTGSTNVHSVGVEAAGINVLGGDTPIGAGSTIFDDGGARFIGIVTASGFSGDGSSLTGVASTDNIKTSTTANFTGGIQVGGSTTLTGALSATTATANLVVVGSAVTSNSQGIDVTGVVTATSFVGSGANLTSIPAGNLTGTVADARISTLTSSKLSGALPAISAANLTNIPAANITGTLPAISGANLTGLPAARSYRNLIINGAMTIAQRGTSSTSSGMNTIDRWTNNWSGGGVTQSQVSEQSGTAFENGFSNYLRLTNTSNTTTDTDYRFIGQTIEAQNVANSGWNFKSSSSYVTLSAWVRSSLAGTYYGWLNSRDGTGQTYTFSYTLSANTWTKLTKTIPGNSNVSVHNNTEEGLVVHFIPWYGTYYTTSGHTLNAWQSSSSTNRTPDYSQNWANTSNATFDVTGVQLEVGSSATTFEHRSVADELTRCQRYYFAMCTDTYEILGTGHQYYSGNIFIPVYFPTTMRAEPTLEALAGGSGAYVYEKLFGNSAQYHHQISQDTGKTGHNQSCLIMSGDASRQGQTVRCSAHSFGSNTQKFVAFNAEI